MARSIRKRHREKQQRSNVSLEFIELIELLRKVAEYDSNSDDNDDKNDDNSIVIPPPKRIRIKHHRHLAVTTPTDERKVIPMFHNYFYAIKTHLFCLFFVFNRNN